MNRSVLTPRYPIRTERLALRPYQLDDFEPALRYWSRDDVTRYLYLPSYTRETFGERLGELLSRTALAAEGDVLTLAIVPDDVGEVVGDVTLFWRSEDHRTAEVASYHPDHRGRAMPTRPRKR